MFRLRICFFTAYPQQPISSELLNLGSNVGARQLPPRPPPDCGSRRARGLFFSLSTIDSIRRRRYITVVVAFISACEYLVCARAGVLFPVVVSVTYLVYLVFRVPYCVPFVVSSLYIYFEVYLLVCTYVFCYPSDRKYNLR